MSRLKGWSYQPRSSPTHRDKYHLLPLRFSPCDSTHVRDEEEMLSIPGDVSGFAGCFFPPFFSFFCQGDVYCRCRFYPNLRLFVSPHRCETTSIVRLWTNILSPPIALALYICDVCKRRDEFECSILFRYGVDVSLAKFVYNTEIAWRKFKAQHNEFF